ncbi:MAG: ABC transporter ATP-binding protein [Gammaproteobacteria bacterium]
MPTPILNDVNLSLSDEELTVVVGRSGSGKSTLLNIIGAMDIPDAGSVHIDDQDICQLDDEGRASYRRKQVGFIFQSYNLIPTLTVAENLLLPIHLAGQGNAQDVERYLDALGLADRHHHWPDQLSGGEQQRVAIIRALIHQPQIVIADEPTGNLDEENSAIVIELLMTMVKQANVSLLLATHDLDICRHADRVLRIESGRLVTA